MSGLFSSVGLRRGRRPSSPPAGAVEAFLGRVEHDADDSEEVVSSGTIYLNSPYLELGEDDSEGPQVVGVRFRNTGISQGETINSASLRFTSNEALSDGLIVRIWAEDADDPAIFSSTSGDLSGRTKTTASVDWDVSAWSADGEGAATTSPDLSSVVQEVVNRAGFSGNIAFLIEKSPTNTDETNPRRSAYSHETDSAKSPQLAVNQGHDETQEITEPPGTTDGDYFVATDGDDSNDGLTEDTPFRNINKAASVVAPGDLVLMRGGTYNEQVLLTTSGTSSDPITWAPYPGETVIVDGFTGSYDPDETGRDIHYAWRIDCDWQVVRDLTTTNANFSGMRVEDNNNTLRRVTSHTNRYHGFHVAGDGHLLEDCVAYDNQQPNCGFRSDRGECQQSADGFAFNGTGTARRCVAYHNADDGFDSWGADGVIVEDSVAYDNGYDSGNGNGFKGANEDNSTTTLRHCVSFSNLRRGFTNNGGSDHTFYNNTSFDNGSIGFQNVSAASNVYKNNIANGHGSNDFQLWSGGSPTQSHNTWNESSDAGGNSDFPITDPDFKSTTRTDADFLALAATSPCIDAGTDVGLDFDGSAPDLGALKDGETIEDMLGRPLDGV